MRDANERLVLTLVRKHGALPKRDIARLTGLSAQTVSVIMRELEVEGLLIRGDPVRGQVGQPSVPMSLAANGAFFLGMKIGRRSSEIVLIDFLGSIRQARKRSYPFPSPDEALDFLTSAVRDIQGALTTEEIGRIAGLGIAMPFELWNWADAVGAPREIMDQWRYRDIQVESQKLMPFPVSVYNDATAACAAELVFGSTQSLQDFIYFYIGAFAGGGIVLNGALYAGRSGNAGALGSMLVPGAAGTPVQLIDVASLTSLEREMSRLGQDASFLWVSPETWAQIDAPVEVWLTAAGRALAHAIVNASAVIDFEAAVIDGWMPEEMRRKLVYSVQQAIGEIDAEGVQLPHVREGSVGAHARALGAASLPLFERFMASSGQV